MKIIRIGAAVGGGGIQRLFEVNFSGIDSSAQAKLYESEEDKGNSQSQGKNFSRGLTVRSNHRDGEEVEDDVADIAVVF